MLKLNLSNLPVITSVVLIAPVIYWVCYYSDNNKNSSLLFLLFIILIMSIVSVFFWSDPVSNRNTLVHTVDAACARVTIFTFIVYNLYYQIHNSKFFLCMAIMFLFFYLSDSYSAVEWCGNDHIYSHFGAHMFALAGIYFTFFAEETKQIEEVMGD
jgi:hypothetical protein